MNCRALIRWIGLLLLLGCAVSSAQAPGPHRFAAVISIDGPIGAASSGYLRKSLDRAVAEGAAVVVLRIDTPGGLDSAMRDMIKHVLASPIPVLGFVGPSGARAASAGTFLLYATHVAAMAPGTNLGSATPVPVGGGMPVPAAPKPGEKPADDASEAPPKPKEGPSDAMGKKVLNDAVAYIRGLAEMRGRNADWAEQAVREGVNLGSTEALELKVIDLIVPDVAALLAAVDGQTVTLPQGDLTLVTAELAIQSYAPDWRDQLLSVLANPTVAYLLLLAGIYGLLLEGYNPGALLPGTVGGICLLLALFAFQILPINYAGLGLMVLGVVLIVGEALVPSFGVLGFGGIAAFVLGSVLLIDTDIPGYGVNLGLIGGIALSASLLMLITLHLFMRARRAPVFAGQVIAAGTHVLVSESDARGAWGQVDGERWRLQCDSPLAVGQQVRVEATSGLILRVKPLSSSEKSP